MIGPSDSPAMRRFIDYFGELGQRWGLPAEACRVHAYLYLVVEPSSEAKVQESLELDESELRDALTFLVDFGMISQKSASNWCTSSDPWHLLVNGLEARRRRELPTALATLRNCHDEALADGRTKQRPARQIGKMIHLVEDLAALDAGMQQISPRLLRGAIGITGRAAKLLDRARGTRRGERQ